MVTNFMVQDLPKEADSYSAGQEFPVETVSTANDDTNYSTSFTQNVKQLLNHNSLFKIYLWNNIMAHMQSEAFQALLLVI
jgi:hypothetical protein